MSRTRPNPSPEDRVSSLDGPPAFPPARLPDPDPAPGNTVEVQTTTPETPAEPVASVEDAHDQEDEPTSYEVAHAAVGPHYKGQRVTREQLIPVPRGTKDEDAAKIRFEGIKRLVELGAIIPVYEAR